MKATAWAPSSLDVREILLAVPSATTSWANVALPGGGIYGLMPPAGEVWLPLSFAAFVGGVGFPGPGAKVEFEVWRDGDPLFSGVADASTGWRTSEGGNDASARTLTDEQRLRVLVQQRAVTATNMMVSVRYLIYHK